MLITDERATLAPPPLFCAKQLQVIGFFLLTASKTIFEKTNIAGRTSSIRCHRLILMAMIRGVRISFIVAFGCAAHIIMSIGVQCAADTSRQDQETRAVDPVALATIYKNKDLARGRCAPFPDIGNEPTVFTGPGSGIAFFGPRAPLRAPVTFDDVIATFRFFGQDNTAGTVQRTQVVKFENVTTERPSICTFVNSKGLKCVGDPAIADGEIDETAFSNTVTFLKVNKKRCTVDVIKQVNTGTGGAAPYVTRGYMARTI